MNKNIISQLRKPFRAVMFLLAIIVLYACNDTYDKHYDGDPTIVSDTNLWETIESVPELSTFSEILKKHGYDQILSQSQAYTIFAPTNEALLGLDTSDMDVKKELLENHIARYFIPASGENTKTIATQNKKRIQLTNMGNNFVFGETPFASPLKTLIASNGIIHLLGGYETFFPNTRELMTKMDNLDSIGSYLSRYDERIFYPELSVPGGINELGQQEYLDSVFVNYNKIQSQFGLIDREDSSYMVIVPTNKAWIEAYDRIKDYYVYYDKETRTADSLQREYTTRALVQDMFFNLSLQGSMKDSLVSTYRKTYVYPYRQNVFYDPQELLAGSTPVETSNGIAYITDHLNVKDTASWHQPIIVEAEHINGRENTLSLTFNQRATGDYINTISNGYYLQVQKNTPNGNPTVTFSIPNTLSSTYDIYCVFVSHFALQPNALKLQPNLVFFTLNYTDNSGKLATARFPESGNKEIDTYMSEIVLVASDFKFPIAGFKESYTENEVHPVSLKVSSNVPRTQTSNYSRDLLIDCIILVPKSQH